MHKIQIHLFRIPGFGVSHYYLGMHKMLIINRNLHHPQVTIYKHNISYDPSIACMLYTAGVRCNLNISCFHEQGLEKVTLLSLLLFAKEDNSDTIVHDNIM